MQTIKDRETIMKCFCIGCGASLIGFDFNKLNDPYVETIGTNYIMQYYPKVKACVFLDQNFFKANEELIKNYKGAIWAHDRAIQKDYDDSRLVRFYTKQWLTDLEDREHVDQYGQKFPVFLGRLSGLTAIHIAIRIGCDEIYLLGYDMKGGHIYDPDLLLHKDDNQFRKTMARFQFFKDMQDQYGYKIFNCNPDSAIDIFPFVKLEDVL